MERCVRLKHGRCVRILARFASFGHGRLSSPYILDFPILSDASGQVCLNLLNALYAFSIFLTEDVELSIVSGNTRRKINF